ncbi:MAG: hypothetical protein ABW223_02935 [Rariglobus sp.]
MNPVLFSRRILFTIAIFVIFSAALRAQLPEPPAATFRILSLIGSRTDLKYEPVYGKPPEPLHLFQAVSRAYPLPRNGRLELFREIPPPPDAPRGTPHKREIFLTAQIPAGAKQSLVIVWPAGKNVRGPLSARVLPDDPARHLARSVQVLNLSRFPSSVALGAEHFDFAAGESRLVPITEGRLRILVQAAIKKDTQWESVYRAERRIGEKLRGFIFVCDFMQDPDYDTDPQPPPVLVKSFFEPAPEPPVLARR